VEAIPLPPKGDRSNAMNKPILIIPDLHQDIRWARRVLKRERARFDEVLFLGDYWDSFNTPPAVGTAGETAKFLNQIRKDHICTFLIGNHDLPYLEAWASLEAEASPESLKYPCPGFRVERAVAIRDHLEFAFWDAIEVSTFRYGHLISHAGFHPAFWPGLKSIEANLDALKDQGRKALDHLRKGAFDDFPAFLTSPRLTLLSYTQIDELDGDEARYIGGPLWLDWNTEFEDSLPVPQIVGHTTDVMGQRRKDRSWCADGYQTCYALLWPDGSLEFRYP
jgi:hypothetical protein